MSARPSYEQLVQRVRELENAQAQGRETASEYVCAPESEAFCKDLVEALQELICRFRPDGTLTFANPAFCICFGAAREDLIGKNIFTLLPAQDHPFVKEHLASLSYHNPAAEHERRVIAKDNQTLWLHCMDCALFDKDHRIIEMQSVARDVTKRKRAEIALRQSEAKYRSIMDAMEDAVYICSPQYRIEYMNRAMIALSGRDATGEVCHKAIFDTDHKCSWCTFDKVAKGENVAYELCHPGNGRCYSVSTSAVQYNQGFISKLAILRDMTEVKKMKEHQRQSQKMESLARLAGGIAHDFNNILAAIYGYTELLKLQIPAQSRTMEHLDQILLAAERAKRLVHQIVQFIRPEHTEGIIINPSDVVSDTLSFMRSSLPATIDLQSRLNSTRGVAIDKEQLSRVVVNLCTNAAHAMEGKGGTIMVSLFDLDLDDTARASLPDLNPGVYVELKVSDGGHGMDTETLRLIFEPYFTTKDASKGSGLGLSIVHGIVKACKGAIRVESRPGKGATFTIMLPAAAAAPGPALQSAQADKFSCDIGSCILFIDDDFVLADLGYKSLEKFGCKVVAETDPIVALRKFKEQPKAFDLVITDMTMPKMTGDRLAKELLATRPDIPIILCTGFNQNIDNEAAKKLGIKALLQKPFKIDVLVEIVSQVLRQK